MFWYVRRVVIRNSHGAPQISMGKQSNFRRLLYSHQPIESRNINSCDLHFTEQVVHKIRKNSCN